MNSLAIARTDSAELFVRWQKYGDHSARDELVTRFLPLARKLARRYAGAREPFEDLLQVASLGLVKAVDRFDAERDGDSELADFFRRAQAESRKGGDQGKEQLRKRL